MIFCLRSAWKENFAKKQESHKRELAKKHFNDNLLYIINAEKDRETIPIKMNGRMNDWQKQFSLIIVECGGLEIWKKTLILQHLANY